MDKILFIRTYSSLTLGETPPLGLMYLASSVRQEFGKRFIIKIVDMKIKKLSPQAVEKIIIDFNPDIIGCSVCSDEDRCVRELADLSKRINSECKFIVGGPHPTMYYSDLLKNENIDIAVLSEGEETFCALLKCFDGEYELGDVSGIAYTRNGRVVQTESRSPIKDLDRIPFPAWDLIDIDSYSQVRVLNMNTMLAGKRYMGIFTSRGCPYQCAFCHNIFGKSYRMRSAENVFSEIKELYEQCGVDEIHIFDDIFNLDKERVEKICDFIISSGMNIKIAFPNALRGDILDEKIISKLKDAGTYAMTFALETSSNRLQKLLRKNINISKLTRNIQYSARVGLLTKCYVMIGFPSETEEEIKETVGFVCSLPLELASFFIVTPQRGTHLYSMIKERFPSFEIDFNQYSYFMPNKNYEQVLNIPLLKLQRFAYRQFFFNFKRLMKLWFKVPRKIFLYRALLPFFPRIVNLRFLRMCKIPPKGHKI